LPPGWWRRPGGGKFLLERGVLSRTPSGWQHTTPANSQLLELVHVWFGVFWITMRFRDSGAIAPGVPLTLTIWKPFLSSTAWCGLRVCVNRQVAMPAPRAAKDEA